MCWLKYMYNKVNIYNLDLLPYLTVVIRTELLFTWEFKRQKKLARLSGCIFSVLYVMWSLCLWLYRKVSTCWCSPDYCLKWWMKACTLYNVILSLEAPNSYHGSLPANIQWVCQSINGWWTNYWVLPTRRCSMSHFKCQHARNWKFFSRQNYFKKPLATQISRSNACRLLSLGPIEGQSVQNYTPHNRTTQRRYTSRDSSRQLRHFGKTIPEFGEKHSSVLACERRPVSPSIMSRSCSASFSVCVYKFSSHYLNNIFFYRQ